MTNIAEKYRKKKYQRFSYTPLLVGGSGNPGDFRRNFVWPPDKVRLVSPQTGVSMLADLARSNPEGPSPSMK